MGVRMGGDGDSKEKGEFMERSFQPGKVTTKRPKLAPMPRPKRTKMVVSDLRRLVHDCTIAEIPDDAEVFLVEESTGRRFAITHFSLIEDLGSGVALWGKGAKTI